MSHARSGFEANLDLKVLQEALDAIVSRHETLRSNFREVDGLPILVIRPSVKIPMTFVDLSDQPIDCRDEHADRYIK